MRQQSEEKLKHVGVYVPESLYEKLVAAAKKERRSISSTVVICIENAIFANPPWADDTDKKASHK